MSEENRTNKLLQMREEEKKPADQKKKGKGWKKELREWVVSIVVALVLFVVIRSFLFTMIRVDGESMLETLQDGDRLFVSVLDVKLKGVEDGDIIICKYPGEGNTYFVKRVIAHAGDTVEISGGVTYVNGEKLEENYITYNSAMPFGPYTVPEGSVFVMGDNRANSRDSRRVGALEEELIVGKVQFCWWPLENAGLVD